MTPRARRLLAAAVALAVLGAHPALAPPRVAHAADAGARVRARLQQGKRLYEEQEYRKAIRELAPVARDPAATRAQRLQALELLGLCWYILGEEDEAREAFEDLLAIDPGYQLQEASGSPKIEAFFAQVRRDYVPDAPVGGARLEHAAPAGGSAGRKLELEAQVTAGGELVKDVLVRWRRQGELAWHDVAMSRKRTAGDTWRARFTPPADEQGYELEYYLEARDLGGRPVARVGGPETPLVVRLGAGRGDPSGPWYGKWYVWAGGAVVLGAATAITLAATAEDAPEGTLGTVTLP